MSLSAPAPMPPSERSRPTISVTRFSHALWPVSPARGRPCLAEWRWFPAASQGVRSASSWVRWSGRHRRLDVSERPRLRRHLQAHPSDATVQRCWFAYEVIDIETSRLVLHAIDEAEGRRISAAAAGSQDSWAPDYPFGGDLAAVGGFLRATEALGEQRPFGYYQITRSADGLVIGGVGFKGPPGEGRVEIGYGLAPSGRGHGYAAEAVAALLTVAAERGVTTVLADTDLDNVASQRTLIRAGFELVGADAELRYYEVTAARP